MNLASFRAPCGRHVGAVMMPAVLARRVRTSPAHAPVLVYTDASIARGRGGIGFAAHDDDRGWFAAYSALVPDPRAPRDINRLELLAMYVALTALEQTVDPRRELVIFSDSATALNQLVSRRRNRKYGGLSRATMELILARPGWTSLAKVKGHSGDAGNDLADRLAGMATAGRGANAWP